MKLVMWHLPLVQKTLRVSRFCSPFPAEIFDLIALAAAFITSLAVAPLLAFSFDDINRADKRYLEYWAGTTGAVVNSQSVSKGLAAYSSASMALCLVSLIASLVVRMAFYYTDKLTFDSALAIRKRLIPLELCSVLPLVTALFCGDILLLLEWLGSVL